MSKKPVGKTMLYAEATVWAVFVIAGGLAAMSMLNVINLTHQAQAVIGYVLGGYALLVFGYLVVKAVENRA